jgi:hypothetical protein
MLTWFKRLTTSYTAYFLQLIFSRFNLEDSGDCSKDYVTVRNGGSFSSPVVWKRCGSSLPPTTMSMSNQIIVEFHSDASTDSNTGFSFTASEHSAGCGGILHGVYGNVASPREETPGSTRNNVDRRNENFFLQFVGLLDGRSQRI